MKLRVNDPLFLRHVAEYYKVLLPILAPLQCTQGGPVILMQVENEYGYYANDTGYLEEIRKILGDRTSETVIHAGTFAAAGSK